MPGISGLIREDTDKSSTATANCRCLPDRFTEGFHVFVCLSSVSHTVQAEFNSWQKGSCGPLWACQAHRNKIPDYQGLNAYSHMNIFIFLGS